MNKTIGSLTTAGGNHIKVTIEDDVCHVSMEGTDVDLGVPLTDDEVRWLHNAMTRVGRALGEVM